MKLFNKYTVRSTTDIINISILSILGILFLGYSTFYKNFAEIGIKFAFLDFPIFIGEIALFICLVLTAVKWTLVKKQFNRFHILLALYLLFVLIRAFLGYEKFGPLAFRHSAMFYYPLFGVIAYEAYDEKFKNLNLLLILFFILILIRQSTYYNFTYFVLMLFYIVKVRSKALKIAGLAVICVFFPFRMLAHCCRTQLIGHIAGFIILGASLLAISKIKMRIKISILVLCLFISTFGIIKLKNSSSSIKSLFMSGRMIETTKQWDRIIKLKKWQFKPEEIPVRIYNPETNESLHTPRVVKAIKRMAKLEQQMTVKRNEVGIDDSPAPEEASEAAKSKQEVNERYKYFKGSEIPVEFLQDYNVIEKTRRFIADKGGSLKLPAEFFIEEVSSDQVALETKSGSGKAGYKAIEESSSDQVMPDSGRGGYKAIIVMPDQDKSRLEIIDFINELKKDSLIRLIKEEEEDIGKIMEALGVSQGNNTAIFRLLVWRDIINELKQEKAVFGFHFGKPLRSKSNEILKLAYGEWSRDGWLAAHNSYMQIIYRTGIIGVIFILSLLVSLFKIFKSFIKLKSVTGIFLISIIVYWMTVALVYVTFEMPYSAIFFWSLFGITVAYAHKRAPILK